MKKILVATLIVAAIALCAPLVQFVQAQTVDLGVDNVGLLPSNPFYFLKEWSRGVRTFFTPSAIRKAQIGLEIVNEKAAELEQLIEVTPRNTAGLLNAFENYDAAVANLGSRLNSFTDTTANPDVEKLVEAIIGRSSLHQKLFDQLVSKYQKDQDTVDAANLSSDTLADMLAVIAAKIDPAADFRARVESAARNGTDTFRALPPAELAARLAGKVSGETRDQIVALEGDLLADLDGHLEAREGVSAQTLSEMITMLPGDQRVLLQLLDEVREITQNSDLHSALNFTRQDVINRLLAQHQLSQQTVTDAIDRAKALIAEVSDMPGTKAAKESIQRAKFNLDQAEKFSQEENLDGAFGQASAAYAAAKDAWYQLMADVMVNSQILDGLKSYYDVLVSSANDASFPGDAHPEIFALLNNIEKQLLGTSKIVEGNAKPEAVFELTKSIRISLSLADELIQEALHPSAPAEAPAPAAQSSDVIPASATIVISKMGFAPAALTVKAGTKVTWFNKDLQPHWPVSEPQDGLPGFDAMNGLSQGETYSFTFDRAGHWAYFDHLDPELTGTIEVTE